MTWCSVCTSDHNSIFHLLLETQIKNIQYRLPLPQGVCRINKIIRAECTGESKKEIPKIGGKKSFKLLLLTHISGYYVKYKMR